MNNKIKLKFRKLNENATIPRYQKPGDSGMDICSIEEMVIPAGQLRMIHTGLSMELPEGYEMQVRPRSGLSAKHMVTVLNSPGTIDAMYRGEICVLLINHGSYDFGIKVGDRIAQLVICAVEHPTIEEVLTLSETERGDGGFGSTGVK